VIGNYHSYFSTVNKTGCSIRFAGVQKQLFDITLVPNYCVAKGHWMILTSLSLLTIIPEGGIHMNLKGGGMRKMTQPMFGEWQVVPQPARLCDYLKVTVGVLVCSGLFTGCVSTEKFEAEKARALNFQRLLAQEEKRTGELNVKYQDTQRQLGSLESQNRDLNAELEALRDQLNRSHDELSRVREGATGKSDDLKLSEPSISEFGLNDLDFKESDLAKLDSDLNLGNEMPVDSTMMNETPGSEGSGSHTVAKGETLYRISKDYGVSVQDLKEWNRLADNTIHVGQKLIVSSP
jgi:LysM repeat protein